MQSISSFQISPVGANKGKIEVTAVVVPKVTCNLPLAPMSFRLSWKHISDLPLADPDFGRPSRVDMLLGVDVFIDVLRHGRQSGPPNSPTALETEFVGALRWCWSLFRPSYQCLYYLLSQLCLIQRRHPSTLLGD
jgi:hypothetical protein